MIQVDNYGLMISLSKNPNKLSKFIETHLHYA